MQLDDPQVREVMRAVRRADFLPEPQLAFTDEDRALPIGHGQTCSQPTTVRHLLSLLEVDRGHRALDVGSGSGWSTALLAALVGPHGSVHAVELIEDLLDRSRSSLAPYAMPWATVDLAQPGVLGLPAHAPYDRILVSAEAEVLPETLVDQLTTTGRMVVPVAGRLCVVQRRGAQPAQVRRVGAYRFVPLR